MSTSNARKSEFLGMSYGTASNRLKKQVMLQLLQRLNADICYKCSEQIETAEELSIEHIEPWFDREGGQELFWDLSNIAFSHLTCNRPHTYDRLSLRKVGPDGTAWCTDCGEFKPTEEFYKHSGRWNGLQAQCKYHLQLRREKRKGN